jgi:hypothetical protein
MCMAPSDYNGLGRLILPPLRPRGKKTCLNSSINFANGHGIKHLSTVPAIFLLTEQECHIFPFPKNFSYARMRSREEREREKDVVLYICKSAFIFFKRKKTAACFEAEKT